MNINRPRYRIRTDVYLRRDGSNDYRYVIEYLWFNSFYLNKIFVRGLFQTYFTRYIDAQNYVDECNWDYNQKIVGKEKSYYDTDSKRGCTDG